MLSFFIWSIAATALCDAAVSAALNIAINEFGTICHDTPNLSFSHPHCCSSPPAESFSQRPSTSACVSQFTTKEMAGEKVNCGPPLRAKNSCPSRTNRTVITDPGGRGDPSKYRVVLTILEFLKT